MNIEKPIYFKDGHINKDRLIGWTGFFDTVQRKWIHNPIYKLDPEKTKEDKLIEKYHSKRKLRYIK